MTGIAGGIHGILAGLAIVLGLLQFVGLKAGPGHRARGYAYVYGMIVADAAALLIYRFTGQFNILHVGAIANFIWIVLAMIPVLRTPRAPGWHIRHYYFIAWSYVSLLSAGVTQLVTRIIPLHSTSDAWAIVAIASGCVMTISYFVIQRHRPDRKALSLTEQALP